MTQVKARFDMSNDGSARGFNASKWGLQGSNEGETSMCRGDGALKRVKRFGVLYSIL